jgi:predicted RNA-binding Zn-ribbon protein involved in translation (DUF1610 family)
MRLSPTRLRPIMGIYILDSSRPVAIIGVPGKLLGTPALRIGQEDFGMSTISETRRRHLLKKLLLYFGGHYQDPLVHFPGEPEPTADCYVALQQTLESLDAAAKIVSSLTVTLKQALGLLGEYGGSPYAQQVRDEVYAAILQGEKWAGLETSLDLECPDCGKVTIEVDTFKGGTPASGRCPKCGDRLYFSEG